MNTIFTTEDKKEALEFAYAMGLKAPAYEEETESAMSFARAMGLRERRPAAEKKPARRTVKHFPVPALRYI